MTGVGEAADARALDRAVDIGILSDNQRILAAELRGETNQALAALLCQ